MADLTSAKKRVALFLPDLGGGGAERVVLAQARELVRRGHRVDLILVREGGALLELLPAEVNVIAFRRRRIFSAILPLAGYLRSVRPDALHAVMWPSTVIAVVAHILARSRARLMVSDQVTLSQQVRDARQLAALRWTTRLFYPRADYRVTCSIQAANDLAPLARIPRRSIEVITNPIEAPAKIATTPAVEQMWGSGRPRIVTVGSLKAQKNHALLLQAFARLDGHPAARLMIVGEGQLRPELEALAQELGIADRVAMPGFFLDPWPFLASADLFVLSSDYEGFPLVLAEAMRAGLRVVSTDCISGPAELTDNGRYGRLVPCGDPDALAKAIAAALAEPPQPKRQRNRAIAMAGPAQIARYCDLLTG
jgi:glycosyltransferase involved in cell wall biosynthesis